MDEVTDLLARHQHADHDPVNAKSNQLYCRGEHHRRERHRAIALPELTDCTGVHGP